MSYNSNNTKVLETYDQDGNLRMLLMHEHESGRIEYVIGSYFTENIEYIGPGGLYPEGVIVDRAGTCFDVASGHIVGQATNSLSYQDPEYYAAALKNIKEHGKTVHYSWDWGHYFSSVLNAASYWKREVLCVEDDVIC